MGQTALEQQVDNPLRVLIAADNASARFGGESILPLHYFRLLLARGVDVRLLVHDRNRPELTKLFPEDGDRITYIPDTWLHRLVYNMGKWLPRRVHHFSFGMMTNLLTQWMQKRIAKRVVKEFKIDVVHQPMPVSPKQPSMVYGVGAPVLIGPMNGGMSYPPGFKGENGFERVFMKVGRFFARAANVLMPGKRRAALLMVANKRTWDALPGGLCKKVMDLPENAVMVDQWEAINWSKREIEDGLKLVFLGRLEALKAVDALLEGIARLDDEGVRLDVIGDGPERSRLEALTKRLGLEDRVVFHGFVPQGECPDMMMGSDALVLPSIHECGGAVVLEAMCMGLPTVVADWGGPADYVTPECGMLVSVESREALVQGLADAIQHLSESRELREKLGKAGRARVLEYFNWERKIDQMIEIYLEHCDEKKVVGTVEEIGV
ncbi:glycosyltransferase family 4 protein [Poriferisphaera sp. WC338]|uniref:glycosyltransferase family 4 protein n=1 Tax=Poriferisphaera sp. WC338 TaxID=3425129 RepID=UPI003D819A7E